MCCDSSKARGHVQSRVIRERDSTLTNMTGLLLAAALASSSSASELALRSGPARTHLIELYSSEGCSSCPPADDWVESLRKRPGLWKDFVPVAFHVTYWDYLGWKDSFGDPVGSAR